MFGAKRKARKIGRQEENEGEDVRALGTTGSADEPMHTVIRPSLSSRSTSRAKQKTHIRSSFGPSGTSMTEDEEDDVPTAVIIPKKTGLNRQAIERNAARRSLAASQRSEQIPLRQTEDRPSYSADALNELKFLTPSAPKDTQPEIDVEETAQDLTTDTKSRELDLAAKFGSNLAFAQDAIIPTDAEIREKKERRARLAKEHEYISLDDQGSDQQAGEDSDDEFKERSTQRYAEVKSSKYEETRLVRDDEDIAEGFDDFVEDGRIALGRKAKKEQKKRHEAEMREAIERAEGSDDSSEDESEAERNAAYEAAQTRAGLDGLRKEEKVARAKRTRTPPKITPLPSLAGCAERLKGELMRKRALIEQKSKRLEEVRRELEDIAVRKVEVQRLLNEAGERYQQLRAEDGEVKVTEETTPAAGMEVFAQERGGPGMENGNSTGHLETDEMDWDNPSEQMGLGMGT